MVPVFSSFVPTFIKGYLKNKYLKIIEFFLVKKVECCFTKILMAESLLFKGAESGAGEKKSGAGQNGPATQHWLYPDLGGRIVLQNYLYSS